MVKCRNWGRVVSPKQVGPCPRCRAFDRDVFARDTFTFAEATSYATTREFLDTRFGSFAISLGLALGSPFLGLVLAGWPGVIVGLVISAVSGCLWTASHIGRRLTSA